MTVRRMLLALVTVTSLSPLVGAQTRTEITINDTGVKREPDVESGWNGVLRQHGERHDLPSGAGSVTSRTLDSGINRRPLTNVLGVLADDKTNTLWVCQNNTGGRGGAPSSDKPHFDPST
jgi:hypothetical protein